MPLYKIFVAVQFNNRTHAVIPNHWIFNEGSTIFCRWPAGDVDGMSEANANAEDSWSRYKIEKIMAQSSE
jgi:hypothetical protein